VWPLPNLVKIAPAGASGLTYQIYSNLMSFCVLIFHIAMNGISAGKTADVWLVVQHKRPVGNTQELAAAPA